MSDAERPTDAAGSAANREAKVEKRPTDDGFGAPEFGTYRWGMARGGRLTRRERLMVTRDAVTAQSRALPGLIAFAASSRGGASPAGPVGGTKPAAALGAQLREPPTSRLAAAAADELDSHAATPLAEHSYRTWYFADLFSQFDTLPVDPEHLYVACLLHDLALTDRHPDRQRPAAVADDAAQPAGCFAVAGAVRAYEFVRRHGGSLDAAEQIADAVTAHYSPRVPRTQPLGHLLNAAAYLDIVGYRIRDLPRTLIDDVNTRHPRAGITTAFGDAIVYEAAVRPASRAALLHTLGSGLAMRLNPLNRTRT